MSLFISLPPRQHHHSVALLYWHPRILDLLCKLHMNHPANERNLHHPKCNDGFLISAHMLLAAKKGCVRICPNASALLAEVPNPSKSHDKVTHFELGPWLCAGFQLPRHLLFFSSYFFLTEQTSQEMYIMFYELDFIDSFSFPRRFAGYTIYTYDGCTCFSEGNMFSD